MPRPATAASARSAAAARLGTGPGTGCAGAEVLYALEDPFSLLVLALSFLTASVLAGWTSALLAARAGETHLRAEGRLRPDPRRHVDPFGAVAAVLSGLGWPRPVPVPRAPRGQLLRVTLAGPLLLLAVGAGLLVGFALVEGPVAGASTVLLKTGVTGGGLLPRALLLSGLMHLFVGLLCLVPLPPMPGGQLLFGLAPRTRGWQQAETYLVERNLGVVAVLVLLLFSLGGPQPLLLAVLTAVGRPLVALVTGA
ncbi:MAG: hypothetical protein M3P93_11020 [Actinomycetota bacterium]|nr:hypothetical protein [Actinomycetota bacterium]